MLASLVVGCSQSSYWHDYNHILQRGKELGLSDQQNSVRVNEIAERVQNAYDSIDYLSFRAEPNWEGKVQGYIETFMGRGRLKTRLRIDGRVVYILTCRDNTIEELKLPFKGEPEHREVRPADAPGGTHDLTQLQGIEEYGCMLGGYCSSWVGNDTGKPVFFVKRIREGYYLGQTVIRGVTCDLVVSPAGPQYGGIELIYIRPDGFVVQNDSFYKGKGDSRPRLMRQRPYLEISPSPLPDSTWSFERPVDHVTGSPPVKGPMENDVSS